MVDTEIPTTDQFRPVVLSVMADGELRQVRDIYRLCADAVGLTDEQRAEMLPSGEPRYVNRAGWAISSFSQAGLLERPKRAWYRITANGLEVARRNLATYTEQDMLEWPTWRDYREEVARRNKERAHSNDVPVVADVDPLELLDSTVASYNAEVETELRRALQASSPEFFEKAVVELLWAMGYGGAHGEKQHVGRAGDGGIDGVIRQDALGLHNVYIQAKRYADGNNVQRPAIQQFYGALASRGAERGVFITTSEFSQGAKDEAEVYRGQVILIDGLRLTSLMLAYGVGVQKIKEISLYAVDDDFFEEG